ncbi:hypothetical protein DSECCO2_49450 [anaerobic digester metagenome]
MIESYYELCLDFFREDGLQNFSADEFIQKLFFLHPTLKIEIGLLHRITKQISDTLAIPYHDIKVIGSSHTGFSFIDKNETGNVKFYDQSNPSDIDIAIINNKLFVDILEKTATKTDNYTDNTSFKSKDSLKYFKKNIPSGFIRPDSIGCEETRNFWFRFFSDLSSEYDLKISGAIYLNEVFFILRLKDQLNKFQNIEEVKNGIK